MTDPLNTSSGPAGGRSRRMAGLVLLLVAVGGAAVGVALDRLLLLPMHFGGRPFGPGRGGPPSARMEGFARERFARELGLSDSQKVRIDSLMERQMVQLRAVRGELQPRLDSILSQTRRSIDAILTPEQRVRAEQLMRRRPGHGWRGGRGGPGDGAPGPEGREGPPDGKSPDAPGGPPPR